MSRAAQEMQRIADELKRQRTTKKGRHAVDELEDVTEAAPATPAQPAAAAEETKTMAKAKKSGAKTSSAERSRLWRENKKKQAAGAPAATDKASVKAQGKDDIKTVFVTTTVALAQRAFKLLLAEVQANPEAPENAGVATDVQRVVSRLGA